MDQSTLSPRNYDKSGRLQMAEVPLSAHSGMQSSAHFVVHHYEQPDVVSQDEVTVTNLEGVSWTLSLDALESLPSREVEAVIECAGNGRGLLKERAPGNQFGLGLFHQARWRGVSLKDVLAQGDSSGDWTTLVVDAADEGVTMPEDVHAGFGKGLPRAKALHPDTILAWEVNGEPLSPDHGAPLRLIVPGWFGIWWVKWVQSLRITSTAYDGFWQKERYTYQSADGTVIAPVGAQLPRAVIVTPEQNDEVMDSDEISILAWAGENAVAAVEFTADDGLTWRIAEPVDTGGSTFTWSRFRAAVPSGLPRGRRKFSVRAIDGTGRTQSWEPATNRLGYGNNGIQTVEVQLVPQPPQSS